MWEWKVATPTVIHHQDVGKFWYYWQPLSLKIINVEHWKLEEWGAWDMNEITGGTLTQLKCRGEIEIFGKAQEENNK